MPTTDTTLATAPQPPAGAMALHKQKQLSKADKVIDEIMADCGAEINSIILAGKSADDFRAMAINVLRKTPTLANCDMRSLSIALMNCSLLDLMPNNEMQECFIVPYNNKGGNPPTATLQIGYRGWVKLIYNSGAVSALWTDVVCENDVFEAINGTEQTIKHVPELKKDRGAIYCAYAVAKLKDGTIVSRVCDKTTLDRAESASKGDAWKTDYAEMCMKTTLIRIAKTLPKSIAKQIAIAEQIEYLQPVPEQDNQQQPSQLMTGKVDFMEQ